MRSHSRSSSSSSKNSKSCFTFIFSIESLWMNMQLCVLLLVFFSYIINSVILVELPIIDFLMLCSVMILIVHTVNDDGIKFKRKNTKRRKWSGCWCEYWTSIEYYPYYIHSINVFSFPIPYQILNNDRRVSDCCVGVDFQCGKINSDVRHI